MRSTVERRISTVERSLRRACRRSARRRRPNRSGFSDRLTPRPAAWPRRRHGHEHQMTALRRLSVVELMLRSVDRTHESGPQKVCAVAVVAPVRPRRHAVAARLQPTKVVQNVKAGLRPAQTQVRDHHPVQSAGRVWPTRLTFARHRIRHGIRHTAARAGRRSCLSVGNGRLRHMRIGSIRVSQADGSQSLAL